MISYIIFILVTIVLLCLIGFSFDQLRTWRKYKKYKSFYGPPAYPLIGNGLYLLGTSGDMLSRVMGLFERYPTPLRFWVGTQFFVVIGDPEQLKVVLNSPMCLKKGEAYKYLEVCVGEGLVTAPVSTWRKHRKYIMPTFNQKLLESFVSIFHQQSLWLTRDLESKLNQKDIDIYPAVQLCTLDTICETIMGVDMQFQKNKNVRCVRALENALDAGFSRAYKFWLHPDFIFNLTSSSRILQDAVKYLHDMTNEVIQNKRRILEKSVPDSERLEFELQKKVFLDRLMSPQNEAKFTDKEIRDETITMLIGGSDTLAGTLVFVMLMLADFPEVQNKVYEELFAIYGSNDPEASPVIYEDLQRMEYLERVIKETLRLFPAVPLLLRKVEKDVEIGEHILLKGCTVACISLHLHRNEKFWPKPLQFDPDRFLPENVAKRHPYSHIPFSAGPRNCIGQQFAMIEAKTILAIILRKFVLKNNNTVPISDIKLKADIFLKPVNPIKLQIIKRC